MDSLYHFIFALVGGYVLVRGFGVVYSFPVLFALAFASVLIDLDHMGDSLAFHNLFVLVPLILLFLVAFFRGYRRIRLYSLVLSVMVYGHLLSDMGYGRGVPLFYPLVGSLFSVPYFMLEVNFVSRFGVVLLLYFGVIALLILGCKVWGFFR